MQGLQLWSCRPVLSPPSLAPPLSTYYFFVHFLFFFNVTSHSVIYVVLMLFIFWSNKRVAPPMTAAASGTCLPWHEIPLFFHTITIKTFDSDAELENKCGLWAFALRGFKKKSQRSVIYSGCLTVAVKSCNTRSHQRRRPATFAYITPIR